MSSINPYEPPTESSDISFVPQGLITTKVVFAFKVMGIGSFFVMLVIIVLMAREAAAEEKDSIETRDEKHVSKIADSSKLDLPGSLDAD